MFECFGVETNITESTFYENDSFYVDIEIVDNWLERATADYEELIMSMLQRPVCEDDNVSIEPKCTCKDTGGTIAQHGNKNSTSNSQMQTMQQISSSQQISSACQQYSNLIVLNHHCKTCWLAQKSSIFFRFII